MASSGPYSIGPESLCGDDCFTAPGFMFSVKNKNEQALSPRDIVITGVSFEHLSPKRHRGVKLYRTNGGSYTEAIGNPESDQWFKISSEKVPKRNSHSEEFVLDTPVVLTAGETVVFYVKTEESILLVGKNDHQQNVKSLTDDDGRLQLSYGSAIMRGSSGNVFEGYSWNGAVTYSTNTPSMKLFH